LTTTLELVIEAVDAQAILNEVKSISIMHIGYTPSAIRGFLDRPGLLVISRRVDAANSGSLCV